jgi:hypothetical protein
MTVPHHWQKHTIYFLLQRDDPLRGSFVGILRHAPELFRRMVFNALISNIDDHPRNHAVIAKNASGTSRLPTTIGRQPRPGQRPGLHNVWMTFCSG